MDEVMQPVDRFSSFCCFCCYGWVRGSLLTYAVYRQVHLDGIRLRQEVTKLPLPLGARVKRRMGGSVQRASRMGSATGLL